MFVKLTAILAATMISITPMSASATFAPALPYIPPADVQLFDLIYNAYGVTAPVTNETREKRLQGYLDLYSRVLGASNEQFLEDIQTLFTQAKTGRALNISTSLSAQLMQGMKEAVNNGIYTQVTGEAITGQAELVAALNEDFGGFTMDNTSWIMDRCGVGTTYYAMMVITNNYNQQLAYLMAYPSAWGAAKFQASNDLMNIRFENGGYTGEKIWLIEYGTSENAVEYIRMQFDTSQTYTLSFTWRSTKVTNSYTPKTETVYLQAQNEDVKARLDAIALHPLTKYTVIENGVVDDTKPIRIDLPITLPVPADEVVDLPVIQDKMQVVPISDNPQQTVSEMQETAAAELGTTQDYALNLTELFPFCIPFDIARVIGLFVAEPQTPVFQFAFPIGYENGAFIMQTFEMNLAALDGVAVWVRRGLLAVFVVGLGMVTRQVFLRG